MFKLLTIIWLTSLLAASSAFGSCTTKECKESDVLCDQALEACKLYVGNLETEVAAYRDEAKLMQSERDEAYKQLKAEEVKVEWYWYVLGGIVSGVVIGRAVK